jgi:hypothetical protein
MKFNSINGASSVLFYMQSMEPMLPVHGNFGIPLTAEAVD